jgi:adenylosuccinate lyase
MEGLVVNADRMKQNMEISGGTTFSQTLLLKLVDTGMTREEAYAIVQRNAHAALETRRAFSEMVMEDPDVKSKVDADVLASVFDPEKLLARTGAVVDRVFGEEG